jgi:hypothetical protein
VEIIYAVLGYLAFHFLSYFSYFKNLQAMRTEIGILLFHFLSFFVVVGVAYWLASPQGVAYAMTVALTAGAAHGIYSLSFLELWSLAEGSYSLQILRAIETQQLQSSEAVVALLSDVGERKKNQRLGSLEALNLVSRDGNVLELTAAGRLISRSLRAIRWLTNLQDTG